MGIANRIMDELYFVTTTTVDWIDIFNRPKYKHIILESLCYCQQHKGMKIYAWVLMSNHLHAIISATETPSVADIMRDFKKFTSKRILTELETDQQESRRKWMLERFCLAGNNNKKIKNACLWQNGYYPELLCTGDFYRQKLNYIHMNPVRQEIVCRPEEYLYSSAVNYAGEKGLLDVEIVI